MMITSKTHSRQTCNNKQSLLTNLIYLLDNIQGSHATPKSQIIDNACRDRLTMLTVGVTYQTEHRKCNGQQSSTVRKCFNANHHHTNSHDESFPAQTQFLKKFAVVDIFVVKNPDLQPSNGQFLFNLVPRWFVIFNDISIEWMIAVLITAHQLRTMTLYPVYCLFSSLGLSDASSKNRRR